MITGTQFTRFCAAVRADADAARRNYELLERLLDDNDVKYGTITYSPEMTPAVFTAAERAVLQSAAEQVVHAAECFTEMVVADHVLLSGLGFTAAFADLVRAPSGYGRNIPCARFDSVLDGDRLTFIELNTDGCSGMTNADMLNELHLRVFGARSDYGLDGVWFDRAVPQVLDTLCDCYSRFREQHPASALPTEPVIGILDLPGEATSWEFEAIVRACAARGLQARIVTPAQAQFDGRVLRFGDTPVHVIYRRLLGSDYQAQLAQLAPISAAFLARRVCMVGAPRSQIAFNKKLFAYLHEPTVLERLPDAAAAAVQRHVPWTRALQPMRTSFHGERIDLLPFVRANPARFVIKPCVSKLGLGITQGPYVEQHEWERALQQAADADYIVQEFITMPAAQYPPYDDPTADETRYVHLGEYVFGGRFCGVLGRTCRSPLLSLATGERLLPVYYNEPMPRDAG